MKTVIRFQDEEMTVCVYLCVVLYVIEYEDTKMTTCVSPFLTLLFKIRLLISCVIYVCGTYMLWSVGLV